MKVKMKLILTICAIFSFMCSGPALAWTLHPAVEYTANELPAQYGTANYGLSADYNYGDLTFHAPYPDPQTLTDMERYMLGGAHSDTPGHALKPWVDHVFQTVSSLHMATGEVPADLSLETLRELPVAGDQPFDPTADHWNLFRSPITGEFPRLDAQDFSPGQVFIRELTEDEVAHFASVSPIYEQHWIDGVILDPETDEVIDHVTLSSEIYYMRVYGVSDVIYSNIVYSLAPQPSSM
jgi:hypothetical protein